MARLLLRDLLEAFTGFPARDWTIVQDPGGRPFARTDKARHPPAISLSHSRDWIACAVGSRLDLGIDIEVPRVGRDLAGIAEAAFGPQERLRAAGGPAAFYRIWTLREAMAKATGRGLAMAADRIDRVAEGPDIGTWTTRIEGRDWWLHHQVPGLVPDPALSLAVGGTGAEPPDCILRWWNRGD